MQRGLVGLARDDLRPTVALANTLNAKGETLFYVGQSEQAIDCFREANRLRGHVVSAEPDNREYRRLLANTHMNIGIVHKRSQDFSMALDEFKVARSLRESLLSGSPNDTKILRDVAKGHYALGDLYDLDDQIEKAHESFDAAIEMFQRLIELKPTLDDRFFLCGAYFGRAGLLGDREAITDYELALSEIEPMIAFNPNVEKLHSMALSCRIELAYCQSRLELTAAAIETLQLAKQTAFRLAHRESEYLKDATRVLLELAKLENAGGTEVALLKRYRQAIVEAREEFPDAVLLSDLDRELADQLRDE